MRAAAPPELRQGTQSYMFTITSDPIPPHAREDVIYTITVKDREDGPADRDRRRAHLREHARRRPHVRRLREGAAGRHVLRPSCNFVTSGQWAIGIQFHSDSTKPLEKTEWMQDVLPERSGTP